MRLALAALPALLGLGLAPAAAAINPCYLDQMVQEAPRVMQIAKQTVEGPDADGHCVLTGTVVRSFRGDIAVGTSVRTTFACSNPRLEVGGTTYHDRDAVAAAGAVELHTAPEGGPAGYGWGLLLLDAPTDAPAFVFESLPPEGESC